VPGCEAITPPSGVFIPSVVARTLETRRVQDAPALILEYDETGLFGRPLSSWASGEMLTFGHEVFVIAVAMIQIAALFALGVIACNSAMISTSGDSWRD